MNPSPPKPRTQYLAQRDHAHLWHPFTPMRQWRQSPPLVIDCADGVYLIDTDGNRYIDGVSSLWCNVHGHRVPQIDQAIRDQLDRVAHTTLLGLASTPSIELAAMLVDRAGGQLNKVFYSDAGATALEVAFKMAVGYWHHTGHPDKCKFIGFQGAYHGDTTGSMSVGYCELFHRPFASMVFPTYFAPAPNAAHPPDSFPFQDRQSKTPAPNPDACPVTKSDAWPSEDPALTTALRDHCLQQLEQLLQQHAQHTAAIVIEPVMQGAAGMICHPPGFLTGVSELAKKYDTLLIADEVATGFGRTGKIFAHHHEPAVAPDILCLAKGITGGYLPLAATLTTDRVEQAFCGEISEHKTLYHGHTYTGNALACAAAIASLNLFDTSNLLAHAQQSAAIIADRLNALRPLPHILDVRQRGLMVGIELCRDRRTRHPLDPNRRAATAICHAMRAKGLVLRPLGDVIVLMPIPAIPHPDLHRLLDVLTETLCDPSTELAL